MCKLVTNFGYFYKNQSLLKTKFLTTYLTDVPWDLINSKGLNESYLVDLQYICFTVYIFTNGGGEDLMGKDFGHFTL